MFFARSVVMVEREATVRSPRPDEDPRKSAASSRGRGWIIFIVLMRIYY
jgi:hypothetical protein